MKQLAGRCTFGIAAVPAPRRKIADRAMSAQRHDPEGHSRENRQDTPARQLVNLRSVPILIVVSEASYHAPLYDHCTSKYLAQAGVKHSFVRLPQAGIKGNGHMMMLEKNNLQIAALLRGWIAKNIR